MPHTFDTREVIIDYDLEYFIERDCTRWNSSDTRTRLMQFLEKGRMVKDDDSFLRTYCLCCKSRTIYKSKIITQVFYYHS